VGNIVSVAMSLAGDMRVGQEVVANRHFMSSGATEGSAVEGGGLVDPLRRPSTAPQGDRKGRPYAQDALQIPRLRVFA